MAGPLPFSHTWPYDLLMKELYFSECPYCGESNVRIPNGQSKLARAREGLRTELHMPCCHETLRALGADDDYFWADEPLR